MEVLVVEFVVQVAHVDDFAAAIADNAHASLTEERGCRQFDICRDPADPQLFLLYEVYDDEAAVQAHLKAPHFLQLDATTRDWVRSKRVQRLQLS